MRARTIRRLTSACLVGILAILVGCTTDVEVKKARTTLEAARSAGKATQCPADFKAVEDMVTLAESLCQNCKYDVADATAAAAVTKANALCPPPKPTPRPTPAPAPAPEPPPAPAAAAPTASLSAASSTIQSGACTALSWTSSNATRVSIDNGVGSVEPDGSRQVCPTSATTYTLTATGPGGSTSATATVSIAEKAKPTDKLTIHVNFDTNKSDIRKSDVDDLKKAEAFVRKYSNCRIEVDGYTDATGNDKINNPLSERRADAVKSYLVEHHANDANKITTKGFGSSSPIGSNKTAKGRFQNRRAEILVFCQ